MISGYPTCNLFISLGFLLDFYMHPIVTNSVYLELLIRWNFIFATHIPIKLPQCYPASQPDLHPCFCTPEWWYCTVYRTRQWPASRMNIAKHEHYDAGKSETKFSLFGNPHIHLSSLTHLHWNEVAWYFSLLIFKSWEPLITHFQDFHSFSFISNFYVVCIAFI